MCTVSYIPQENGFVLTSNRDEMSVRPTLPIQKEQFNSKTIFFPKDELAGGTWIAMKKNRLACLLNGAFEPHKRNPPYEKSRGILLLEALTSDAPSEYFKEANLEKVEPFTLIILDIQKGYNIKEYRWDAREKFEKELKNTEAHFWSSAPLYEKNVRAERASWFQSFLKSHPSPTSDEVLAFHGSSKTDDERIDLLMNREDGKQTVSITQVVCVDQTLKMRYEDLLEKKITNAKVDG